MAKKLYHKIGEACRQLDVQPYVLRYWETEFPFLKPGKSKGGQRVYSDEELAVIRRIKQLLYEEGYTIAGAKKKLEAELAAGGVEAVAETGDGVDAEGSTDDVEAPAEAPEGPAIAAAEAPQASPGSLDTADAERVETLLAGLREALDRSREILRILGPGAR